MGWTRRKKLSIFKRNVTPDIILQFIMVSLCFHTVSITIRFSCDTCQCLINVCRLGSSHSSVTREVEHHADSRAVFSFNANMEGCLSLCFNLI